MSNTKKKTKRSQTNRFGHGEIQNLFKTDQLFASHSFFSFTIIFISQRNCFFIIN